MHKDSSTKSYEFIFDAKYKIDTSPEYIEVYGSVGPKEEDINTIHTYKKSAKYNSELNRDAIIYAPMKKARSAIKNLNNKDKLLERKDKIKNPSEPINSCIFGEFVLFPYDNEEKFKNHKFYRSIEEVI